MPDYKNVTLKKLNLGKIDDDMLNLLYEASSCWRSRALLKDELSARESVAYKALRKELVSDSDSQNGDAGSHSIDWN